MLFLAILFALVPGLAWLFFYLQEDPHPEPKSLIAAVFFTGGAFAFVALIAQIIVEGTGWIIDPVTTTISKTSFHFIFSVIILSLIEELAKFIAAWWNVHKKPEFDEPIDAMIYVVVAALGFATVENIGSIVPEPGAHTLLSTVYETLSLRFVGATLLHALASGVVGYYWAMTIRDFGLKRYLFFGILLAALLHALFNYLIIGFGSLMYTLVFVLVIGLIVLHDFEKLKVKTI